MAETSYFTTVSLIDGEVSRFDDVLRRALSDAFEPFDLKLDDEVALELNPKTATLVPGEARVVLFFGSPAAKAASAPTIAPTDLLIPVVNDLSTCSSELPPNVSTFNALPYAAASTKQAETLASAVLGARARRQHHAG